MLKLAAVVFVVMGALAAVSCKKEETKPVEVQDVTTVKAVKGKTFVKLYVDTVYKGTTINDSILQMFDIEVEVIAGNDTNRGFMTGKSLELEAVTTTFPSIGEIRATVTPKESLVLDSTKTYTIGLMCLRGFMTVYENGEKDSNFKGRALVNRAIEPTRLGPNGLAIIAKGYSDNLIGNGSKYEFTPCRSNIDCK